MIIFFTMEVNDDKFQALVIIPKKVKGERDYIFPLEWWENAQRKAFKNDFKPI